MIGYSESRIGHAASNPYGNWDITCVEDLVMLRDLINTGTCIWNGQPTDTYKGNTVPAYGAGCTWYVTADIDMSTVCGAGIGDWIPIGNTSTKSFRGNIEGLEHTISNLYMTNYNITGVGLFGYAYAGIFRDLVLSAVSITTTSYYVGALIGSVKTDNSYPTLIVDNIKVYGSINKTGSGNYVGGVLGYAYASSTGHSISITNCENNAQISSENSYVGGIIGFLSMSGTYAIDSVYTEISGCINQANINGKQYVGGISGIFTTSGICTNNINHGNISSTGTYLGGITTRIGVGNIAAIAQISGCYNYGTISSISTVSGGLFAEFYAVNCSYCDNYGLVEGVQAGGIVGVIKYMSDIYFCNNNAEIRSTSTSVRVELGGIVGIASGTQTVNITSCNNNSPITNYSAVNYSSVGGILGTFYSSRMPFNFTDCNNYANLTMANSVNTHGGGISGYVNSNYGDNTTYTNCINYGDIIAYFAAGISAGIKYGAFTDCVNNGIITGHYATGINYHTHPSYSTTYTRCINNKSITGGYLACGIAYGSGNAQFYNCETAIDTVISGVTFGVGICYAGTMDNCINRSNVDGKSAAGIGRQINGQNCKNYGTITSPYTTSVYLSGICNFLNGNINSCTNYGNLDGGSGSAYIGGIVSNLMNGGYSITGCINYGDISSSAQNIGGIVGYLANGASVINCLNEGAVGSGSYVGGIVGYIYSFSTINGCQNTGDVTSSANAGGIVGYSYNSYEVSACSNSGNISSDGVGGGITGLSNNYTSSTGTLTNCQNSGAVYAYLQSGGLIGNRAGAGRYLNMTCCTNTGIVSVGTGYYFGGCIGYYTDEVSNVISGNYYSYLGTYKAIGSNSALNQYDIPGGAEPL